MVTRCSRAFVTQSYRRASLLIAVESPKTPKAFAQRQGLPIRRQHRGEDKWQIVSQWQSEKSHLATGICRGYDDTGKALGGSI